MSSQDPTVFGSLAESLADVEGVTETIDQIVGYAVEAMETSYGGITLIQSGGRSFETVGATHPSVAEADRMQYELREGPCVDAAVDTKIVVSDRLTTDDRWPEWGPRASAFGFNSILCAELHARGRRIGALNLYGTDEATFSPEDIELAALFARQGALALGYARSEEGLREALATRTVIGQAQGLLMERFGVDADRAFSTLQRYSQHHNIKLKVLCRQLVATRVLPDGPAGTSTATTEPVAAVPEPA
ncbi:GAF and ANTAR domain-containing protein [Aeromicrobium sp. NPDC092404]|uniref:GAF and ANTAR domain-containing protein n=1 Tax=Aeromicrobium sp. NPDC092404 TaxID=3154976 RepID=UPI003448FD8D